MIKTVEAGQPAKATDSVVPPVVLTGQVSWDTVSPIAYIRQKFGAETLSFLALFVSPKADFATIVAEAETLFPDTNVAACTTAGEIGAGGYDDGQIIALGFPSSGFATTSLMVEDINDLDPIPLIDRIAMERVKLQERHPTMTSGFAFLLVDGLSRAEDGLTATISPALRDMPMFGGSAGDGTNFEHTSVALNGKVAQNAAILTLVRSRYRTQVFSLDHLVPSDHQMVVTGADPDRRIVKTINAEPAAREYARIVGRDPEQLDRLTFASHPVVVRIGGAHHVRAIQQVNSAGELVFFSAIDEGMVLTVAAPQNMVEHLRNKMIGLSANKKPSVILGCDCILRRIEAEQRQITHALSDVMSSYNVTGFSTYGEQIGALHVNHTMTGVAIYDEED